MSLIGLQESLCATRIAPPTEGPLIVVTIISDKTQQREDTLSLHTNTDVAASRKAKKKGLSTYKTGFFAEGRPGMPRALANNTPSSDHPMKSALEQEPTPAWRMGEASTCQSRAGRAVFAVDSVPQSRDTVVLVRRTVTALYQSGSRRILLPRRQLLSNKVQY